MWPRNKTTARPLHSLVNPDFPTCITATSNLIREQINKQALIARRGEQKYNPEGSRSLRRSEGSPTTQTHTRERERGESGEIAATYRGQSRSGGGAHRGDGGVGGRRPSQ